MMMWIRMHVLGLQATERFQKYDLLVICRVDNALDETIW